MPQNINATDEGTVWRQSGLPKTLVDKALKDILLSIYKKVVWVDSVKVENCCYLKSSNGQPE